MKKIFSILIIAFIVANFLVAKSTWKADPMHSKLTFTVIHLGSSDIFGLSPSFEGAITTSQPASRDTAFELSTDVAYSNTEVKNEK